MVLVCQHVELHDSDRAVLAGAVNLARHQNLSGRQHQHGHEIAVGGDLGLRGVDLQVSVREVDDCELRAVLQAKVRGALLTGATR